MIGYLDIGYTKLLKYFNKHERASASIAAVILNPKLKWTVFRLWAEKDKKAAKNRLFALWRNQYRSNTGTVERPTPTFDSSNTYLQWLAGETAFEDYTRDELERYLANDTPINIGPITAREWWLQSPQRAQFPLLARMAIDILSIPAILSEVERVFSTTKKTIDQGRWRLQADTIKALECLKSWLKAGFFTKEELHEVVDEQRRYRPDDGDMRGREDEF